MTAEGGGADWPLASDDPGIAVDAVELWHPGAGFRSERHCPASVEIVDHH